MKLVEDSSDGEPVFLGIEYSKEEVESENLRFIEAVKYREAIWNRNVRLYKDPHNKDKLFAEIEEELGWAADSNFNPPGRRARNFWAKILGTLRRVQRNPAEIGPRTLTAACIEALDFYITMLDDVTSKREARLMAQAEAESSAPTVPTEVKTEVKMEVPSTSAETGEEEENEVKALKMYANDTPNDALQRLIKIEDETPTDDEMCREDETADDAEKVLLQQRLAAAVAANQMQFSLDQTSSLTAMLDAAMYSEEAEEDEDEVLRFIASIKEREGLWKRSSSFYRMPHMKMVWFAEVEQQCEMSYAGGHNARQRWQRLIASYRAYVSEVIQGKGLGGFIAPSTRAFKYYDAMSFYEESYQASIARRETIAAQKRAEFAAQTVDVKNVTSSLNNGTSSTVDSNIFSQFKVLESTLAAAATASLSSHTPISAIRGSTPVTCIPSTSSGDSSPAPPFTRISGGPSDNKRKRKNDVPTSISIGSTSLTSSSLSSSIISSLASTSSLPPLPVVSLPHPTPQQQQLFLQAAQLSSFPQPTHTELYALIDHVMAGLPLIKATEAKGEIISFLVELKKKYQRE